MTNLNSLVDQIYLINLPHRLDRKQQADKELAKIASQWTIVSPMADADPKTSFNKTCFNIFLRAQEDGNNMIAVFEDDVCIKPNDAEVETETNGKPHTVTITAMDMLIASINALPEDWDVLYLGANLRDGETVKIHSCLHKITKAWTTHAVIYNKRAIDTICDEYACLSMFDAWLSDMIERGYLNAYICAPMIAWQRAGYSDLEDKHVDYSEIFVESEKKLR